MPRQVEKAELIRADLAREVPRLLYTASEAATILGISRSKTYELIQSGQLPSVKIDGSRRVRATDLLEFVERLQGDCAR